MIAKNSPNGSKTVELAEREMRAVSGGVYEKPTMLPCDPAGAAGAGNGTGYVTIVTFWSSDDDLVPEAERTK